MRWLAITLLLVGCGGQVERNRVEGSCGAPPTSCELDEAFGEGVLVCQGWPDSPWGGSDEYIQQVTPDGERMVVHVASGQWVCSDTLGGVGYAD